MGYCRQGTSASPGRIAKDRTFGKIKILHDCSFQKMTKTLFEKIWERHVVTQLPGGNTLLYIDHHLIHEVTSPQAFEGLRLSPRKVRRPELAIATMDHNVP